MKEQIINSLRHQQKIFGDELFEKIDVPSNAGFPAANEKPRVSQSTTENHDEELFVEDFQNAEDLNELDILINKCQKCSLGKTRTNFVFGVGNPNADALLIGEAPGAQEDLEGIPFVGRAGKLLNDILKAINFKREEVYIANILKCRPPNNRDPLPSERKTCVPYLYKQIELINPKIILLLGKVAANALLENQLSLTKMRGEEFEINGIKTFVTYHPAALLRNPNWKSGAWEDVQNFRKSFDMLIGE